MIVRLSLALFNDLLLTRKHIKESLFLTGGLGMKIKWAKFPPKPEMVEPEVDNMFILGVPNAAQTLLESHMVKIHQIAAGALGRRQPRRGFFWAVYT